MSTLNEITKKLKGNLKLVVMIDGQCYDVDINNIRPIWVKPEKDHNRCDCYGICDEETRHSFQVYVIE